MTTKNSRRVGDATAVLSLDVNACEFDVNLQTALPPTLTR